MEELVGMGDWVGSQSPPAQVKGWSPAQVFGTLGMCLEMESGNPVLPLHPLPIMNMFSSPDSPHHAVPSL